MNRVIDHFTLGARDLDQGIDRMRAILGVTLPRGGKHPAMGTHNCVTRTGEGCFFEMIATDPDAPDPPRRRWFSLDEDATRSRLAGGPRALCWVVRTDDLDALVARSPIDLGEVIALSRGDLNWRLTVPADGSLAQGGLIPAFIEWPPGPHPSGAMADVGLRLEAITLEHPQPEHIRSILASLEIEHLAGVVAADRPGLAFRVRTPGSGTVTLR